MPIHTSRSDNIRRLNFCFYFDSCVIITWIDLMLVAGW